MCELLALSSKEPLDASNWLEPFSLRGGVLGPEKDGWGVAYFFGEAAAIFRQPESAAVSPCLRHLRGQNVLSKLFLAHIRRATDHIPVGLVNTHPFDRELGGHHFVFAHHGNVVPIKSLPEFAPRRFRPVGTTDSEHAFCHILDKLAEAYEGDSEALEPKLLAPRLKELADKLAEQGRFNMLLATANSLYAYSDDHLWLCEGSEGCEPCRTPPLALISTYPFDDKCKWKPLGKRELIVCQDGAVSARLSSPQAVPSR